MLRIMQAQGLFQSVHSAFPFAMSSQSQKYAVLSRHCDRVHRGIADVLDVAAVQACVCAWSFQPIIDCAFKLTILRRYPLRGFLIDSLVYEF